MGFLHPWAIFAGIAALALPLVVHWLTRPRPARIPLSTIRFVQEIVQQRRARYRLRDFLVLLLRSLAILLLAWAFARPLLGARPLIPIGRGGNSVRIVVLDVSQSMAAGAHGISGFERGRTIAAKYLGYEPGLSGNLIFAGAQPRGVFDTVSVNFGAMRGELEKASVRPERMNLSAAIARAGELLAQAPQEECRRRELIVISDLQRSNWISADFSPLPADTLIQLESVALEAPASNLAILRVGAQGRLEQGRSAKLEVDVGNYSPTPREVSVELILGEAPHRLGGVCPPGAVTTLTADVPLHQAGWFAGEAKLIAADDALAADDARPFVLHVRPPPTFALITRQPARPHAASSHFLERALVPIKSRAEQDNQRVVRVDPAQADRESIAGASLIVLDHPGKLSPESIGLLADLLRRGRGMLYVASEPIDATNLKLLSDAAGTDLKMPVEFQPPPPGEIRKDLFLIEWRADQVPFRTFGDALPVALAPLRFAGGLLSRPVEGGLLDEQLATYSDRSTALVVTACGAGTLAVLNGDLGQSNLVGSPLFVPLIGELVGRLLSQSRADAAQASGEPVAAYLPVEAGVLNGLTVAGPQSAPEDLGSLSEEAHFLLWRWDQAGPPGVYEVKRDGATVFALAAATPAQEAELIPLDSELLRTQLAGGRSVHFQSAGDNPQQRDHWWAWLLAICIGCMLAEMTVLRLFRT